MGEDHLAEQLRSSSKSFLVIAELGCGKSTIALALLANLLRRAQDGGTVPAFLDLGYFPTSENSNGAWLSSLYERIFGRRARHAESLNLLQEDRMTLLFDSLDEAFGGRSQKRISEIMKDPIFDQARVLICRSHFYVQNLRYVKGIESREIIQIDAFSSDQIADYIRRILVDRNGNDEWVASNLISWLADTPNLVHIVRQPMRLNMFLDGYKPSTSAYPEQQTLLKLYNSYVDRKFSEIQKRVAVDEEVLFISLARIAWKMYQMGHSPSVDYVDFTQKKTADLLREYEIDCDPLSHLELVGYFLSAELLKSNADIGEIDFEHSSFLEFFASSLLFGEILGGERKVGEYFETHITAEVSEFLKEEFDLANERPTRARRLAASLIALIQSKFNELAANDATLDDRRPSLYLAIEQLAYFLGNVQHELAVDYLTGLLEWPTIPEWIKRGIIVGLAFGGEVDKLDQYVNELGRERSLKKKAKPKNDINVGFHLSYFGDQPFDPYEPYLDQGLSSCTKTFERLLYQLTTRTNRPNWRIDLYTMLDLRHRVESADNYADLWLKHRPRLEQILSTLESGDVESRWPETTALRSLIGEV